MKILVTGATGFVGGHVAGELARAGHEVIGLSRRPPRRDGAIPHVPVDLRRPPEALPAIDELDAVVHCAGRLPGVDGLSGSGARDARETIGALTLAIRAGASRFVHLSTLAVSDPPSAGEVLDDRSTWSRRPAAWNHYAIAKIAEERAVREAGDRGRIGVVILRPGIVFGPGDRHATPSFLRALRFPIPFYVGRGDNPVASLVVEELAQAVARAATRSGIEGRCYPLAGREPITQRDLFRFHARVGSRRAPRRGLPRPIALRIAGITEAACRASARPAALTRVGAWIVGVPSPVDSRAAAVDLDWTGGSSVPDAIARSITAIRRFEGGQP